MGRIKHGVALCNLTHLVVDTHLQAGARGEALARSIPTAYKSIS